MPRTQQIAGAVAGVGGTVYARETLDFQNGTRQHFFGADGSQLARLSTPSVMVGLGGGAVSGLLWYLNKSMGFTPDVLEGLWAGYAVGGIPSGIGSYLFPMDGGGGSTARVRRRATTDGRGTARARPSSGGSSGSSGSGGSYTVTG